MKNKWLIIGIGIGIAVVLGVVLLLHLFGSGLWQQILAIHGM